jgi:hypothetical protein
VGVTVKFLIISKMIKKYFYIKGTLKIMCTIEHFYSLLAMGYNPYPGPSNQKSLFEKKE